VLLEKSLDKEYAGITGVPEFNKAAAALAYGEDSAVLAENRVSVCVPLSDGGRRSDWETAGTCEKSVIETGQF
jgi:aspartate aminotransferase